MPNTPLKQARHAAFKSQNQRCFYCNFPMWESGADLFAARFGLSSRMASRLMCTAEHLLARRDGGSDERRNIAAACWHCNQTRHASKSPLDPDRYRDKVQRRLAAGRWFPEPLVAVLRSVNGSDPTLRSRR